eukprot:CAMPEP_0184319688 /NCGR_PEP_ID=MMETSP1049-20130417/109974_1 /TAXON_ID=77928 /ORGANISM="Proteomonas sulcata, Strain CCMP704" /LENGTH=153 /DNA_ID=CAMNT_0026639933 /DNA_START=40 /DNA_END=502 /DNA_ORIENTATION=-
MADTHTFGSMPPAHQCWFRHETYTRVIAMVAQQYKSHDWPARDLLLPGKSYFLEFFTFPAWLPQGPPPAPRKPSAEEFAESQADSGIVEGGVGRYDLVQKLISEAALVTGDTSPSADLPVIVRASPTEEKSAVPLVPPVGIDCSYPSRALPHI